MVIEYYLSPSSPWTYLGHERFGALAQKYGATINAKAVDFGVIFPQSGGLPLPKRAPQRQAYRLVELRRWKEWLGIPLVVQPKFFPVDSTRAALLIAGAPEALRFAVAGDFLAALWRDDRNLADEAVLEEIASRHGLKNAPEEGRSAYEAFTLEAASRGVFGAPSYVLDGEIFWGQDRLPLLEWRLSLG